MTGNKLQAEASVNMENSPQTCQECGRTEKRTGEMWGRGGVKLCAFFTILLNLLHISNAQNFQITFHLLEESPRWTFIGNVSTAPGFMDSIPTADRTSLLFSFLQQTNIKSLLSIHDETSSLFTTVVLDRESIPECRIPAPCVLTFDIAARSKRKDSQLFEIITVNVVIEDKNDNKPIFPHETQDILIPESAVTGTSFLIDSAEDIDMGVNNSIQYYELTCDRDTFVLDTERKLDGSLTAKLVVIGKLDRESRDFYNCTVIARDGGKPQESGIMKLNITILDENDNAPVLVQTSYDITVKESIEPGTGILQIQAKDADIGPNGQIMYRLSPHQADYSEISRLFAINGYTGVLSVREQLVYVPGQTYKIIVEAVDNGNSPKFSANQAVVNVNIEDTGNNPPKVTINLLSSGSSHVKDLSEFSGEGTFVAHVNVEDSDTGANGVVTCEIAGDLFKLESLPTKGFKVVVNGKLDREIQDIHTVLVTCRDHGAPTLSSSASFLVRVTDENDNAPRFAQINYIQDFYENNNIGDVVLTVSARDDDMGNNSKIQYYLDSFISDYFKIDPISGTIRARYKFDRENKTAWTFMAYAQDQGIPPLVGNTSIMIRIRDLNDNPPQFSNSTFRFTIRENLPAGFVVNKLTATDPDEYDNAAFTFALNQQPEIPFLLFPDGVIKSTKELDREVASRYEFIAFAIDKGEPTLTSSATVIVDVIDQNDETPVIKCPRRGNNTIIIPHMLPIGSFITQIEAYDRDEGLNQELGYMIEYGNADQLFNLDARTGVLSMARRYKVEEGQDERFTLVVAVYDGGIPQRSERCEMAILIKFSNETIAAQSLEGSGSNTNVAIAVVVSLLTFLLSTAIIVVICVIRKFDRDRMKNRQNIQIHKLPNNMTEICENGQNGSVMTRPYDKLDSLKKKKEVSFSFEDDLDGIRDHDNTFSSNSVFGDSNLNEHERHQSQEMKTFQLHQQMLKNQPKTWTEAMAHQKAHEIIQEPLKAVGHPEDNHSDTSRETVTSDSGRGGSDEDLPISHNSSKDDKDPRLHHSRGHVGSSQTLKCSLPNKYRHDRPHSTDLSERGLAIKPNSFERSLSNLIGQDKPKFTVRKPYKDRTEVRDPRAQSEGWVPSYV